MLLLMLFAARTRYPPKNALRIPSRAGTTSVRSVFKLAVELGKELG